MDLACGVDLSHRLGHKICEIIIPNENLYKVQTLRKHDRVRNFAVCQLFQLNSN